MESGLRHGLPWPDWTININGHCLSLGGFLEALDPHGSEPLGQQLQLVRLGHVAGQGRPI